MKNEPYIKRPLMMGTLFYIIGLIGGRLQYNLLQFSFFFLMLIIIVIRICRYYKNAYLGLYLLIACIGAASIIFNPILRDGKMFSNHYHAKIWVQGEVLEVQEYSYQNQYMIRPSQMLINGDEKKIKSFIQIEAKKGIQIAQLGDRITISGVIEGLSFPRNPGAFNEHQYKLTRKVTTKVKAKTIFINKKNSKLNFLKRLSYYYGGMFEELLPWDEAQIMKAMLVGDKTLVSQEMKELYKSAGIAHVLAISGLHISVIAAVLWWIFKKLRVHKNLQEIIVIIILWGYAGITGFSISITRSVIMATTILLGTLLEEKSDPITSLSFAALILLVYNNLYLWDIGFQLSFVAVGSLILLTPFFNKIFVIPKRFREHIAPLIAVTVGTTPLIAYYFYVISPIGIFINLLLIPFITLVVIIGFLAMLIFPIQGLLAQWVLGSSYYLLLMIEYVSKIAIKMPLATIIIGQPSLLEFGLYILFWIGALYYLSLSLEKRKKIQNYIMAYSLLLILIMVGNRIRPGNLEVTFLDVGQGDSAIIITPDHKTFIIDGGESGNGKKIEQFLKYKGVRKVNGMILSHAHTDHMNGLTELARLYQVDNVFLTEFPLEDSDFKEFYDTIESKGIPIYQIQAGDLITFKDCEILSVHPFKDLGRLSGNDASAILMLKHEKVSYCFTGDIEKNYEEKIVCDLKKNDVNILKVPHHGSKTSSTQALLTQLMPDIGIVSCGKNNFYQHPHEEVVLRYQENSIPLIITKDSGAVISTSNGEKVKVNTMEDKGMLWE